jgi:adenylate cyclase
LDRALAIEPSYCEAHSNLALTLLFGWIVWGEPQVPDRANALLHAQRAVEIDTNDSGALSVLGLVQVYERNWYEAKTLYDAAIRLNPNNADAFAWMAELHVYLGRPQDALAACAEALRTLVGVMRSDTARLARLTVDATRDCRKSASWIEPHYSGH